MKNTRINLIIEDLKNQRLIHKLNELNIDATATTSNLSAWVFELMKVPLETSNQNYHDEYLEMLAKGMTSAENDLEISIDAYFFLEELSKNENYAGKTH